MTAIAKPLISKESAGREASAMRRLGAILLVKSPWVRLVIYRLMQGDWSLSGWRGLRDGSGNLQAGTSLILHHYATASEWFAGIEDFCASGWMTGEQATIGIRLHPTVTARDSRRDDFSWAPFKAPLYLFDYLGWLNNDGKWQAPMDILSAAGIYKNVPGNAGALLRDITRRQADLRGFVAIEKALRALHDRLHQGMLAPADAFALWMDALMACAMEKGAIEILAAEPGQARHGRGLFGDRRRKLVKWVIHEEFNECVSETQQELRRIDPKSRQTSHGN